MEGDGDAVALPLLMARIIREKYNRNDIIVAQGKSKVVKSNGRQQLERKLERFIGHAQKKPECGAILILVDADTDCPVTLARQLSQRCAQISPICPIQIVCADRTFESWFIASLDTIKGWHGVSETAAFCGEVEKIANPKRWIGQQMPDGQAYKETTHQVSFSRLIDLDLVHRNSRSFRRLCHSLEQLLLALDSSRILSTV